MLLLLIVLASFSALMVGFGCWEIPGSQSDFTHALYQLQSPSSSPPCPTKVCPMNDFRNSQMLKRANVKWFCHHDNLFSSVLQVLPLPSCCLWLWWVLVLEWGLQWGHPKSHGVGRQRYPQSAASPWGQTSLHELKVIWCHASPGSFPRRPQPRCLVPSCMDMCFGLCYKSFSFVCVSCREKRRRGKEISSPERPMVSKNKSESLA